MQVEKALLALYMIAKGDSMDMKRICHQIEKNGSFDSDVLLQIT